MKIMFNALLVVFSALLLTVIACGGGGDGSPQAVNTDRDGDGIPNTADAAPDDPAVFSTYGSSTPVDNNDEIITGTLAESRAYSINESDIVVGILGNSAFAIAPQYLSPAVLRPVIQAFTVSPCQMCRGETFFFSYTHPRREI